MTSADKAGIIIAVVITAIAVGFSAYGGQPITSVDSMIERATVPIKEVSDDTSERLQEIKKSGTQVMETLSDKTKQAMDETRPLRETAKELATSKLPARLVSIPLGTNVPGCEEANLCYDPSSLIVFKGAEIVWKNDDTAAHTVTSGNILEGPSGDFDSGLIKSGQTFSHRFDDSGVYPYFCMIHPWAKASVTVK